MDSNLDGLQTEGNGDQPNQDLNLTSEPEGTETLDEADVVEKTTLSQSYLFRQGIGIAKCLNAQIINLSIPDNTPIKLSANTPIYLELCNLANSFPDLLSRVLHQAITPLLLGKDFRNRKANVIKPSTSFEMKLKLGFLWIVSNSQESFPAPKLPAYNSTMTKHGVICIMDTLDSKLTACL